MGLDLLQPTHILDTRVKVLRKSTAADDGAGGRTLMWTEVAELDAKKSPINGDEFFFAGQTVLEESAVFWVLDTYGIAGKDRLKTEDGVTWEIRGKATKRGGLKRIFAVEVK